jgi:chlorite dismutase
MAPPVLVSFVGGDTGAWRIDAVAQVTGATLPQAARLDVIERAIVAPAPGAAWILRGSTGHARYTARDELRSLRSRQEGLSRPAASRAALIPIRKTEEWWELAQDERRTIIEERSRHIAIGLEYLPAVARRLHHSRELGDEFDFLTWFEFAPEDESGFDRLVQRLRDTEEWRYVDREVEVRLTRL